MCIKLGVLALCRAFSKEPLWKVQVFLVFCYSSLGGVFVIAFLVKGPIDMRPVSIEREEQWTFFTTFHFTPTGRKGNCMSKITFFLG